MELQARFSDDEACRQYLRESRWADGFCCPAGYHGDALELPAHVLSLVAGFQTFLGLGSRHGARTYHRLHAVEPTG